MFTEAGIPVFDADAEVRAMQGPGGELIPAIEAAFPGADKAALARLEAIVHPAVAAKRAAFTRSPP
jgi:dephospho-CoA kinase